MVTPLRPAGKGMCGAAAIRVRHTLAVSKFLMASLQVVAFDMAAEAGRQATCGPAGRKHARAARDEGKEPAAPPPAPPRPVALRASARCPPRGASQRRVVRVLTGRVRREAGKCLGCRKELLSEF